MYLAAGECPLRIPDVDTRSKAAVYFVSRYKLDLKWNTYFLLLL